jgi:hypothetical protein
MNTGAIFFEGLPDEVKERAYKIVAEDLLQAWLDSYQDEGDVVTDTLMWALENEKGMEHYAQAYELAKELGDE